MSTCCRDIVNNPFPRQTGERGIGQKTTVFCSVNSIVHLIYTHFKAFSENLFSRGPQLAPTYKTGIPSSQNEVK